MGLTKNMLLLLLSSKHKRAVSFESMIMIGRQKLHLKKVDVEACLRSFNYSDINKVLEKIETYAEPVFNFIGSKTIDSLDASPYEEATVIQDLNVPLNSGFKQSYNLVLDSGTLEHVFNVPEAIKTCMKLTKKGGHFIGVYPCNNFFGHGFYQFSSELFYRTFSEENGFKIEDIILFVDEPNASFFSISDTSEQYQRVQFTNRKPVYIYVLAKKLKNVTLFQKAPLQMDYSQIKWKGKHIKNKRASKKNKIVLPLYFRNLIKAVINKKTAEDITNFKKPFLTKYALK